MYTIFGFTIALICIIVRYTVKYGFLFLLCFSLIQLAGAFGGTQGTIQSTKQTISDYYESYDSYEDNYEVID
jgi:hypothetical protein